MQLSLQSILDTPLKFLDAEKLKVEKALFNSKIRTNVQLIEKKQRESSQRIDLESLGNIPEIIKSLIGAANKAINEHNTMVSNLVQERLKLTNEVWKYLLEKEIKNQLATYTLKKENLNKAIAGLTSKIEKANVDKRQKQSNIQALEKNTTSIQPTIDGINLLLTSFGFRGFSLAKSAKPSHYKIVRADGTDAKETLSDGEKTFIAFLYFYHLLKGSETETGITTDRVIIFDDPVSSSDSDVLFIVSTLIKGLFEDVRNGRGHIKQVFVLTHNVYFHKEVTFNQNRADVAMREETFWIVRKPDQISTIKKYNSNPIKTSYDLLWAEVRNPDRSNLSIQNTLRRILESYFKILGNQNLDKICDLFEGKEKLICKSLISWVNEGSHFALDDICVSIEDGTVEVYLNVFRNIFEKTKHISHYKMMMGDAFIETVDTRLPVTPPTVQIGS